MRRVGWRKPESSERLSDHILIGVELAGCLRFDPHAVRDGCVPYFDLTGDALPAADAPTGTVQASFTGEGAAASTSPR